ncbi:beta strand repeat-containing protein, partial [Poseidonibacter lekithochrous]
MKANINFKSRFKILKNGKISLILSALLGSVTITVAAPTGGKVTSGNATISQSGNITNINQASSKASINWQDFSIKQHETVNFKQPDVNSITLNRVVGNEKSIINGALNANGQVWILNSNGVLFGKKASINTSGIVASTLNMSDKDFNEGNYKFSGDSKNSIINEGRIDIRNTGYASFFGQKVVNEGVIKATLGDVNLVSASEVTLNLNGNSTLSLTVNKGILDSLIDNKGAIYTKGGEVLLSANAVDTLVASVVNNEGIVEAQGFSEENGVIKLSGDIVVNNGTLNASGENGGDITTHAKLIIDNGISDVSAKTKAGNITQIADEINQTSKAILKADAKEVAGKILLNHKNIKDTSIYASGKMSAKGKAGGNIKISSETVKIVGAKLDSSGTQNAGEINLGGEWQGKNETIKNAKNTEILNSNITNNGKDAVVTVWSNEKTLYNSKIEAKNGNVEISSKGNLGFDGDVIAKNLLLDPKNITIKDINTYSLEKTIINPTGSLTNKFGLKTLVLDNGNFVVSTSGASISGIKSVGKVYMYDSSGALISTLSGSNTSDYVGTYGINLLSNGNFVIKSPLWNTHRGAVTWVDKNVGLSGVVSSANSLVGTTEYDNVGYTVTSLTNGNYVITSSNWDRGAIQNVGAVTWGNGTTGTVGEVSIANSLVGSTAYDSISNNNSKVTDLKNGKYVISSYYWDNGSIKDVGSVTLVDGTTAASGEITASNSLVGHAAYDYIGSNIHVLSNGNFLVSSVEWNNGSAFDAGVITWVNSNLPLVGTVNESNSLVGSSNMDYIGDTTVHELGNGNFVLTHKNWDNGSATNTGAITWVDGSKGISGVIGESNSLVGSSSNDKLNNVKVLNNGNYVVYSSSWNNGNIIDAGAVTWADGTIGIKGVINQNNSLVGTTASDHVGMGITALNNGNYVIKSSNWINGNVLKAGAVTWADGTTGIQGTINSSNSLIGQVNNDQVGLNGITALNNGSYIVNSSKWNNGNILKAGAVTWTDNMTGISGFVNSSNSLIGSSNNDYVGSNGITVLSNGNYIVNSSNWNNGSILKAGAVTWANSNTGIFGVINSSNSLIGINNNDQIGSNGITVLNNSNYVVNSSNWNNGSILKAGAVTWGNGNSGISGAVSSSNSLIGASNNDQIGLNGITALNNGNYIINSSNWNNGSILKAGAVTWGNGNSGALGVVSSLNSIIGINNNDSIGSKGITALSNGNYIVNSFINKGVATFLDGTTQTHGTINNSNSLYAENTTSLLSIKETIEGVLLIEKDSSVGGTIYKVNKNYNTTNSASNALFTSSPSANSIITTTSLKTLLDSGTAVTLQANNDISVDSDIIVNNTSGNGGDFTLEAGRNITFNSNIFTDNGNFTAIAGSANANSTYKDSGTPTISITNSASINAGTANIKLHSNGGNFINNSGSSTPFTSSLTSIYLDSFTNATLNNLAINSKRYNTTYDGGCLTANCILPTSGVNMLYSIAPQLTVSTIGFTTTYGDDINIGGAVLSGFVDEDFYLTAGISGTAVYDITGTKSSSGKYSTGTHDIKYVSGLISKYGYGFIDNTTDTNELTVNKKALSLSNIVASNKVYDGNTTANTSGTLVGVVSGDSIGKNITSTFSDKNAGNSKTVTINSLVLSGLDKDNYAISSGQTATANISKKALSLSNIVASKKVYDGNTTASTSGTLVGVVSGDNIDKNITSTFSDKNAGNSKTVTINSLVLSGLDKDNYSITSGQTSTADISKKALSLSNIVASNKVYDGNTT